MTNGGQHLPDKKSEAGGKAAAAPAKQAKAARKPTQAKK
jgi:hypothetical protein